MAPAGVVVRVVRCKPPCQGSNMNDSCIYEMISE